MFLTAILAACLAAPPEKPTAFEFKDGDRIVWIGGTLVEREQRYGYWETALIAANADKRITVRNLGWSGDTVFGESRGRFDFANAEKCFRQLVDQTLELKPTVIFVSYGKNESFEGKAGLAKFEKGLEKLLDALNPAKARVVLFTPLRFEKSASLPNPDDRNKQLAPYAAVIRKVAKSRDAFLIDLEGRLGTTSLKQPSYTENGIHLTQDGYRLLAREILERFGLASSFGPSPATDFSKLEPLRKAVVAKNELFFHRWRPENETYLFGFRKYEQGKNAKEVAEFDPLVAKAEEEIAKLLKELKQ